MLIACTMYVLPLIISLSSEWGDFHVPYLILLGIVFVFYSIMCCFRTPSLWISTFLLVAFIILITMYMSRAELREEERYKELKFQVLRIICH